MKAISWQLLGLFTMSAMAWFHTGSIAGAFSLALSSAVVGLVCFFFHERLWAHIRWGFRPMNHN